MSSPRHIEYEKRILKVLDESPDREVGLSILHMLALIASLLNNILDEQ